VVIVYLFTGMNKYTMSKRKVLPARFAPRGSSATATTTAGTTATTAVTATTAKAIAAAATESTAATCARFARAGLVNGKRPATQFGAVKCCHCFVCVGIRRHFYKRKTTRLSCFSVFHNLNPVHLAICGKRRVEILLCSLERDVPDINILQDTLLVEWPGTFALATG
jgi:hypothetical protein